MTPYSLNPAFSIATKSVAASARIPFAKGILFTFFPVLLMSGCSALPDKPVRAAMVDFGPGNLTATATVTAQPGSLPPIAIDDITTAGGALDNTSVLYRLAYADPQELRPYSLTRWTMAPAQLVRQRLRDMLGQSRIVYSAGESAALNRSTSPVLPRLLRLELQEFSQVFTAPDTSVGLIRLRATLLEITPAGEKLVSQRGFDVQRLAVSNDATGGVRALTAATDAAVGLIDQWLQAMQPR